MNISGRMALNSKAFILNDSIFHKNRTTILNPNPSLAFGYLIIDNLTSIARQYINPIDLTLLDDIALNNALKWSSEDNALKAIIKITVFYYYVCGFIADGKYADGTVFEISLFYDDFAAFVYNADCADATSYLASIHY